MYEVCINNDFGKHKKSRLKNFLVHNKLLVFFSMCLLLGVFCGSLLMTFADEKTLRFINVLFLSEIQARATKLCLNLFITSLSLTFFFLVVAFFTGLSLYGFVLTPMLPFLRGVCIGLSEAYLYSAYSLKGLGLHSLMFLPGVFVSSLAILAETREAFKMSNKLSALAFSKDNPCISSELKRYFFCSGFITLLAPISAGVDLIMNFVTGKIF